MSDQAGSGKDEKGTEPTAASVLPPVPGAVSPGQLRSPDLPVALFRGYEREATDRLIERAAKTVEGLGSVVTRLRAEIEELKSARDEAQRKFEGALDATGVHKAVGEVLVTAHRAAETLREEAEQKVQQAVAEAEAEARRRAESLVAEAEQARDAGARAREEAALALSEAEHRAAELVDSAKAEREQLLASAVGDLAGVRAELEAEVERLRAEIDGSRSRWASFLHESLMHLEGLSNLGPGGDGERGRDPQQNEADEPIEQFPLDDDLRGRLGAVAHPAEDEAHPELESSAGAQHD
jgi:hypothetical protein